MGNTQALPGIVATVGTSSAAEPHEVIYEQALRRIAELDGTWQEAVRGVAVPAVDVPVPVVVVSAPAVVVSAPAVVAPAPDLGPAVVRRLPPLPREPLTVTAEITAIAGGPETAEAVVARAAAPRWRRSLAY